MSNKIDIKQTQKSSTQSKKKPVNTNEDLLVNKDRKFTPKERILAYCHQCCCYQAKEVKLCPAKSCPLWDFKEKYYKTPSHYNISEDRRKELSIKMKNIRANNLLKKTNNS